MAKKQISANVPERRELTEWDPTGETWVLVRPPGWAEDKQRGRMLTDREYTFDKNGFPVTKVDVNTRDLWEVEIWITYQNTNLEAELVDADGKVVDKISFKERDKIEYDEFMENLSKLPPETVAEWRAAVVDVVPDWRYPF